MGGISNKSIGKALAGCATVERYKRINVRIIYEKSLWNGGGAK